MKSIVIAIHKRMNQLEEQVLRSSSNEWLLEMSQWHNLNASSYITLTSLSLTSWLAGKHLLEPLLRAVLVQTTSLAN